MLNSLRGGVRIGGQGNQPSKPTTPIKKAPESDDSEQSDEEDRDDDPAALDQDPKEYAAEILQLEIQAEETDVKMEIVQKLMTLYTRAVNYYVSRQSDEYKYFKKKMRNLLVQPQVNEALEVAHHENMVQKQQKSEGGGTKGNSGEGKTGMGVGENSGPSGSFKPDRKKVDKEIKLQQFELEKNLINSNRFEQMTELMRAHEINSTKNNTLVHTGFKRQLESLQEKLAMRKGARSVVSREHSSTWGSVLAVPGLAALSVAGDAPPRTHSQERKSSTAVFPPDHPLSARPTDPLQLGAPPPAVGLGMKRSISHGVFLKSSLGQEGLFGGRDPNKPLPEPPMSSSTGGQTDLHTP